MGKKIQTLLRQDGEIGLYMFYCPGCKENHAFTKDRWTYNGDEEKPTFSPSLLYPEKKVRCHLFLTDGLIKYLSDCGHELAGETVEVPKLVIFTYCQELLMPLKETVLLSNSEKHLTLSLSLQE